ncbi:hypothetical protein MPER_04441 [Moniliophthora perniciosa FA553]|nr:hypothetical protein MPER_04441 [Moniliophthora perniciosa FA553]
MSNLVSNASLLNPLVGTREWGGARDHWIGLKLPSELQRLDFIVVTTQGQESTVDVFQLEDSRRRPWATLRLFSGARSSRSLPMFYESDKINGVLELDGDPSIKTITVDITGRLITGARVDDINTFRDPTSWSGEVYISLKHLEKKRQFIGKLESLCSATYC